MREETPDRDAEAPRAPVVQDPWTALRALTPARIALGRSGAALPTAEVLAFGLAHAQARDAVHVALDSAALLEGLETAGWPACAVASAVPDRATYLRRPDLGRQLDAASRQHLQTLAAAACDLAFVVADGLSALAVQSHALALLNASRSLLDPRLRLAPVCVVQQGRVAIGDEIGALLRARLVAVLIGERPGLSAPDSLGVYLTCGPRPGRTDAERNCLSNVRPAGLPIADAARKLAWLVHTALARGITGVSLKEESEGRLAGAGPDQPEDNGES